MKKHLLLPFLLLSFSVKAQTDTIPNAGFENWIFGGWGSNPADWIVNNSQIVAATVVPDTDSHSGATGMMMINSGNFRPYAACNFLLSQHPDAFTGFMKNNLLLNDTGTLRIRIFAGGVLVDSGYVEVTGGIITSGYFAFSVAVSQNSTSADSCEIILEGGNLYLSQLTYDDLSLTFSTGIDELPQGFAAIWPNPCTAYVDVTLSKTVASCHVEITDLAGRLIGRAFYPTPISVFRVETMDLAAGSYLVTLRTDSGISSLKLIKQ